MIRTIITPDTQTISFDIPSNYVGQPVEIIAFAKDEALNAQQPDKKNVTFEALSLDTQGYKFSRDEANER